MVTTTGISCDGASPPPEEPGPTTADLDCADFATQQEAHFTHTSSYRTGDYSDIYTVNALVPRGGRVLWRRPGRRLAKTLKRMLDHGHAITAPRIVALTSRYSCACRETTARAFSLLGARPSCS